MQEGEKICYDLCAAKTQFPASRTRMTTVVRDWKYMRGRCTYYEILHVGKDFHGAADDFSRVHSAADCIRNT